MRSRMKAFSFSTILGSGFRSSLKEFDEAEEQDVKSLEEFVQVLNRQQATDMTTETPGCQLKFEANENILTISKLLNDKESAILSEINQQINLHMEGILTREHAVLLANLRVNELHLNKVLQKLYIALEKNWTKKLYIHESVFLDIQSTNIVRLSSLTHLGINQAIFEPNYLRRIFFRNLGYCTRLQFLCLTDMNSSRVKDIDFKLNCIGVTKDEDDIKFFLPKLSCYICIAPKCRLEIRNSGIFQDVKNIQYYSKLHLNQLSNCQTYSLSLNYEVRYRLITEVFPYAPKQYHPWS